MISFALLTDWLLNMFKDISALKRRGSDFNPFDSVVFIQNEDCRV